MHRFHCPLQNISQDKITVNDPAQVHHLRDVLRLKTNDEVIIFDEYSNEYYCLIKKLLSQEVILEIKARHSIPPQQDLRITVACAIPKKSKMDDIVDKLTQLGVERIIPMQTERVVIRLNKHKKILRQERWRKIALAASQQSKRHSLVVIDPIKDIKEILQESGDFDLKLIPTLIDNRKSLKEIFKDPYPKNILVLIGPEGDFTPGEVALAKTKGYKPIDLGDLVLRVDTAAIAVTSYIRLAFY